MRTGSVHTNDTFTQDTQWLALVIEHHTDSSVLQGNLDNLPFSLISLHLDLCSLFHLCFFTRSSFPPRVPRLHHLWARTTVTYVMYFPSQLVLPFEEEGIL